MAGSESFSISDESKKFLQNSLEDLKFVGDHFKLKGYSCCTCRKLAIRHCIANCGDVFCNRCYHENYHKPCPYCKKTVARNSQDPEFERTVFNFKVECQFKKNGCEEIVMLRDFLAHFRKCKFSEENLLPKLYKEDPIANALEQLNGDYESLKQEMESVQAESIRIYHEFQEMKDSLTNNMGLQETKQKELDEIELRNEMSTKSMEKNITELKNAMTKSEETAKALQEKSNGQMNKSLAENELRIKTANKIMQKEITELKNALKEREETAKASQEKNNSQINKSLSENELRNETATKVMQNEIMKLKNDLKKSEETAKALQEKSNSQMNKSLADNELLIEKTTKIMQKEIMELKNVLKKSETTAKALLEKNNSQINKSLSENELRNETATKVMQNEIMKLKNDLKKSEERAKALQEKSNSQMNKSLADIELLIETTTQIMQKEIMELKNALKKSETTAKALLEKNNSQINKSLKNSDVQNKVTTEIMQKEIMELKDALKKSENATEDLHAEHKREIHKSKHQQKKHLEELETNFFVQFGKELNECRYLRKGDFIGSPPVVILWKVDNVRKKFQKKRRDPHFSHMTIQESMSKNFFNCYGGLKFAPMLYRYSINDSFLRYTYCINIKLHELENNFMKHFQYFYSVTYILLDQSNAFETRDIKVFQNINKPTTNNDLLPGGVFLVPYDMLEGETRYMKNDQILIKIILEPISSLYNNVESSNGILLWRINNYSKKKQNAIDRVQECLKSKPFKTSEKGYLLQVHLYLNGDGSSKGQFLSLVLGVLKGEHDANLPKTFAYQYSCFILDQSDSCPKTDLLLVNDSIKVSETDSTKRFENVVRRSQAENEKYLKDDSLLIKLVARVL